MAKPNVGTVYLVGAGPGDLGLLTLRGAELLRRAAVVVHDALVNPALLDLPPADAEIISVGKRAREHTSTQEEINQLLVEHAQAGKSVVRLKGGDPYVFGRGGEEAAALATADIPFEVVPGVSSFGAVASYAGIPLTHRECASGFTVVTGHEDPARATPAVNWSLVAAQPGTKVVLMAMDRLEQFTRALRDAGLPADTPAALVRQGTTGEQQTVVGTLEDLSGQAKTAGLTAPVIAIFGEVVRLRSQLNWFERRPLFGKRVVISRQLQDPRIAEFRDALRDRGAVACEVGTVRPLPPSDRQPFVEALAGLGEYDWAVFADAPAAKAFFDGLLAAFEDIRAVGNLRLATADRAAAEVLRELHLRADATPTEFTGPALAEAISSQVDLENLRVLLVRGEHQNPEICRHLEGLGTIVDDVAFYRPFPETEDRSGAAASLVAQGADWLAFWSAEAVEGFQARFDLKELTRKHRQMRLASGHAASTRALANLGLKPHVETKNGDMEALAEAIARAAR